jgi:hypothetical protein
MLCFCRSETGEQRVGVRRLVQKQNTMPASVISSQSMHLGVLASASHAIKTNSIFLVYYRPRFGLPFQNNFSIQQLCLFSANFSGSYLRFVD